MRLNPLPATSIPGNVKHASNTLNYLNNRPARINWEVVAGNRQLNYYESYDLLFDDKDFKIRGLR
jgi:hypothetical protein